MVQVEKPVPKPRTIFPSVPGFKPVNSTPLGESRPTSADQISTTDSPLRPSSNYGWHPKLTDRTSSVSSEASSSSGTIFTSPAPPPSSDASPFRQLSPDPSLTESPQPPPPPVPPPPKLPPHFSLPIGPAPPIPPRMAQEKPLPQPIDEEPYLVSMDEDNASIISSDFKNQYFVNGGISKNGHHHLASSIDGWDESTTGSTHSLPSYSTQQSESSSTCDVYEFLRPAMGHDILLPKNNNNTSPKAEGESVCLSGWVHIKSVKKETKRLWALIRRRQLLFMPNDEDESLVQGPYDLSRLLFIGKSTENASDVIVVLRPTKQGQKVTHVNAEVLRFAPEECFCFWISLLAKCNCPNYSNLQEAIAEMDAGGKVYIREGATGLWNEGYAFTKNNTFYYFISKYEEIKTQDIRKFANIKMDTAAADYCNHISHSHDGPLHIILDGFSIYLQNENDAATKTWFNFLQAQLKRPTNLLTDCRLTSEDVPVIVDKCIKFVSTYGIKQAGLYRKNGLNSEAKAIFESLKKDPLNTHLVPYNDETINAIADVLRSFFRQLEIPLIPPEIQPELYTISDRYRQPLMKYTFLNETIENARILSEKAAEYRTVLKTISPIHYNTIKKLVDHLVEVNAHESENRASIDNLSRVFGPTIFTVDKSDETPSNMFSKTGIQIGVMRDLIELFDDIFEIKSNKKAVEVTEEFESKCTTKPRAEGFLIPVHLYQKDNRCFNVQSNWTAEQVIEYKVKSLKEDPSTAFSLYEVVKDGNLERQVGEKETINSIALERWLNWEASDAFLLLKKECYTFNPANIRPFAEDIKICEPGSKSFKSAQLKIENGKKIQQFPKGEKLQKPQKEWSIDETIWFLGNVSDRKYPPNYSFTTTFLLKSGKYNTKLAGFCVAFTDEVQRNQWLNAVIACQRDYTPIVLIPDL